MRRRPFKACRPDGPAIQNVGMDAARPLMERDLPDEAATSRVAAVFAKGARTGDIYALAGDLGAGKTAFARAFVNALPGETEDVPSPTFTLVQTYDRGGLAIAHFDLYRIEEPEEAFELGIEDAFHDGVSLIEWPERLGPLLPAGALTLRFAIDGGGRTLAAYGNDNWRKRLEDMAFDG